MTTTALQMHDSNSAMASYNVNFRRSGFYLILLVSIVLGALLLAYLSVNLAGNPLLNAFPCCGRGAKTVYQTELESSNRPQYNLNQTELESSNRPQYNLSSLVIPTDYIETLDVSKQVQSRTIRLDTCHKLFTPKVDNSNDRTPLNTLFIFTGRWFFLRVQLPQVYRELRRNGGVIDRVWFMLMSYSNQDYTRLAKFALTANTILGEEVFSFHKYTENVPLRHGRLFGFAYCEMFAHLMKYPLNRYFKIDDDVVYINPGAFTKAIEYKTQHPQCLIGLFNIAGGNWMINRIYQENGVFDDLSNPSSIDFNRVGGEGNVASTLFALRSFLHYWKLQRLDKLFIDSRATKERFTINAAMYDAGTFDMKIIRKAGPINFNTDEPWWTVKYPMAGGNRSNCIVGDALVVHFSHADHNLAKRLIDETGILKEFESVVIKEKESMKMDDILWELLNYTGPLTV